MCIRVRDEDKQVKTIAGKFENAEGPVKRHNVEPIYFHVILNENKEFNKSIGKENNTKVDKIQQIKKLLSHRALVQM